jgi:hypothetical protein
MGISRLDEIFTRWTFKQMLLKSAYSVKDMESMISQTPFGKGRIEVNGIGFQAWLEKLSFPSAGAGESQPTEQQPLLNPAAQIGQRLVK